MPPPQSQKPKGCTHAALHRVEVGNESFAVCKACRRVWTLLEGGKK